MQLREVDAEPFAVRELGVVLPGAGEVRVESKQKPTSQTIRKGG
jgi:hypothetical protein